MTYFDFLNIYVLNYFLFLYDQKQTKILILTNDTYNTCLFYKQIMA